LDDLQREVIQYARVTWTKEFSLEFTACSIQTYASGADGGDGEEQKWISLGEALEKGMTESMFQEVDADGNGRLTLEEFTQWRQEQNKDDGGGIAHGNQHGDSKFDESWAADVIELDASVYVNAGGLIVMKSSVKPKGSMWGRHQSEEEEATVCTVLFSRIRDISLCAPSKVHAMGGQDSFTLTLLKNDGKTQLMEIASVQAASIHMILKNAFDGVKHRSQYCVAKEVHDNKTSKYGTYLEFEVGDLIVLDAVYGALPSLAANPP
jgi:hypothetical protein